MAQMDDIMSQNEDECVNCDQLIPIFMPTWPGTCYYLTMIKKNNMVEKETADNGANEQETDGRAQTPRTGEGADRGH
jgi:hypothetical protein